MESPGKAVAIDTEASGRYLFFVPLRALIVMICSIPNSLLVDTVKPICGFVLEEFHRPL